MKVPLILLIYITLVCWTVEKKNLRNLSTHPYVKDAYPNQKIKKTFNADKNMENVLKNIGCPDNAIKSYTSPFEYQKFVKFTEKIYVQKSELKIVGGKAEFFYASLTIVLNPEYVELESDKLEKELKDYIDGCFYSLKNF